MKKLHSLILLCLFNSPSVYAEAAADAYYNKEEMEAARQSLKSHHGNSSQLFIMADRFEYKTNEGNSVNVWEGQGWYGNDLNKFWIKTEGEYIHETNSVEEAEIQALYSRAISSFWDVQAGLRYDIEPNPTRTYAVFGFQGISPYWFEIDAAAFISEKGNISLRIETEYELLITQRLILQPRVEVNFSFDDDKEIELGSGINSIETGLRLRYEITREFAPYIGVSWNKAFNGTADFKEANGDDKRALSFVAGIRFWY
ncbi:MAG: copper resistance protein B [Gammaproteobacteria bacterium]